MAKAKKKTATKKKTAKKKTPVSSPAKKVTSGMRPMECDECEQTFSSDLVKAQCPNCQSFAVANLIDDGDDGDDGALEVSDDARIATGTHKEHILNVQGKQVRKIVRQ